MKFIGNFDDLKDYGFEEYEYYYARNYQNNEYTIIKKHNREVNDLTKKGRLVDSTKTKDLINKGLVKEVIKWRI